MYAGSERKRKPTTEVPESEVKTRKRKRNPPKHLNEFVDIEKVEKILEEKKCTEPTLEDTRLNTDEDQLDEYKPPVKKTQQIKDYCIYLIFFLFSRKLRQTRTKTYWD